MYNPVLMPAPAVGVSEPQAKSMFRDSLDALRASNAARQTLLSLRRDQLAAMVTLYAALGGGLEPAS